MHIVVVAIDACSHVWENEMECVFQHEQSGDDEAYISENHDFAQTTYGEVIAIVGLAHLYKGKTDTSQDEYDGHDFRHEAEYLASYADDHHYCSSEEDVVLYFCHLFLLICFSVVLLFCCL